MLADAYKIASDIKNAMPALGFYAIVPSSSATVTSFKSMIKASLPSFKHRLSSIKQRLDDYMTNDITNHQISGAGLSLIYVTSVNACMLEMAKYGGIVIDNADEYQGDADRRTWRLTPSRKCVYACKEIDDIDRTAIKCIDVIDKHVMSK